MNDVRAARLGLVKDEAAVKAMTRTGNRREILRGPLFYGLVFVLCTVAFWRTSPIGILALMLMCGGDGLADIVGRRFGALKLPSNPKKSVAGSLAMLLGGFAFAYGFVALFNALGAFATRYPPGDLAGATAVIAVLATIVEALPLDDVDNLTVTGMAFAMGLWWF